MNSMNRFDGSVSAGRRTRLAIALLGTAGVALLGLASAARAHEITVEVKVVSHHWVPPVCAEHQVQIWCEPVYRAVCDDVFAAPVYRTVCRRVWHEPVCRVVVEEIWVPDRYECVNVVHEDCCGHTVIIRERVLVCAAHMDRRERTVQISPGRFEEIAERICINEGHYDHVTRQELVTPGHFEYRTERAEVTPGHWEPAS